MYYSSIIVAEIKSGRIRRVGHGRMEKYVQFWQISFQEKDHLENSGVYGRTLFQQTLEKWDMKVCNRFNNMELLIKVLRTNTTNSLISSGFKTLKSASNKNTEIHCNAVYSTHIIKLQYTETL